MKNPTALVPPEKVQILLVDDNPHGLIARKMLLEEIGYKVTTASCAEDALEYFSKLHYDLVVTDHKMPRITGIELIHKIRTMQPSTPIIMLSGFVEALGLDEQMTGADLVIAKSANEVNHLVRGAARLLNPRCPKKPVKSYKKTQLSRAQGA